MTPQKLIKKEALGRLRGHWPSALGVLCLPAAVWVLTAFAAEYICYCGGLFAAADAAALLAAPFTLLALFGAVLLQFCVLFFVVRPMMLGVTRWWCALAHGKNIGAGACLYYFAPAEYGRCMAYSFRLLGRIALRAAPILLGILLISGISGICARPTLLQELPVHGAGALQQTELTAMGTAFTVTAVSGVILLIVLCIRFLLSDYLYITERELNCINRSAQLMRGYNRAALRVLCAFLWWALLSLFVIPLLFTLPYFGTAIAVLSKWIVYNQKQKN